MSIFKKKGEDHHYNPYDPSKNRFTSTYVISQKVTENAPVQKRIETPAEAQKGAQAKSTALIKQEQIIKLQRRMSIISTAMWPAGMLIGFGSGYFLAGLGSAAYGLGFVTMFVAPRIVSGYYQKRINKIKLEAAAADQNVSQ